MLGKAISFIKKKKFMLKIFLANSNCFYPGTYFFDESLMFIYLKDEANYRKSMELFGKSTVLNNKLKKAFILLVKKLFFNKEIVVTNNGNEDTFQATAFFIGIDKDRNGKAFDFENRKVRTFYFSIMKYNQILENYHYFKSFFNTPKIQSYDNYRLIITEELITYKPHHSWSEEELRLVMEDIFQKYLSYFTTCRLRDFFVLKKPISIVEELSPEDEASNLFKSSTNQKLIHFDFPFIRLHGDLWSPNILISKMQYGNSIYYIDFEDSDSFFFLYDIFWLMHEQILYNNNDYLLTKYIEGAYDSYFRKLFAIFDLEFEGKYRLDYLNIYFINIYTKRWRSHSYKERINYVHNYRDMIRKMKDTQKNGCLLYQLKG